MYILNIFPIDSKNNLYLLLNNQTKELYFFCEQVSKLLKYTQPKGLYQQFHGIERLDYTYHDFLTICKASNNSQLVVKDVVDQFYKSISTIKLIEVKYFIKMEITQPNFTQVKNVMTNILNAVRVNNTTTMTAQMNQPQVQMQDLTVDINDPIQGLLDIVFEGDHITAISKDGKGYVGIKSICDNLGIVDCRDQINKLKNHPGFPNSTVEIHLTARDGKQYLTNAIDIKFLPGWLYTINPNNIQNQITKNKLIKYQLELHEYLAEKVFGKKINQNSNPQEAIRSSAETYTDKVVEGLTIVDKLLKSNISDNVAMYGLQAVQKNIDIDFFKIYNDSKLKELSVVN